MSAMHNGLLRTMKAAYKIDATVAPPLLPPPSPCQGA
jgi:hypothetical protein